MRAQLYSITALLLCAISSPTSAQQWYRIESGTTADLHDIAFAPVREYPRPDDVAIAVGDGGVAIRSTNGGWNWEPLALPDIDGEARAWHVAFASPVVGLITAGFPVHRLYRTIDSGATWTKLSVDTVFTNVEGGAIKFISPTTAISVGYTRGIARTTSASTATNEKRRFCNRIGV